MRRLSKKAVIRNSVQMDDGFIKLSEIAQLLRQQQMAKFHFGCNKKCKPQAGRKRPSRGLILCGQGSFDDAAGNQRLNIGSMLRLRDQHFHCGMPVELVRQALVEKRISALQITIADKKACKLDCQPG